MRRLVLISAAVLALSAPAALAQQGGGRPKCSDESGGASEKTKYEVVTGPDGKKIFRIKTGFVICGKVPKPDVLYGLLNTTINYEWENLKQDFMPLILQSIKKAPF